MGKNTKKNAAVESVAVEAKKKEKRFTFSGGKGDSIVVFASNLKEATEKFKKSKSKKEGVETSSKKDDE